MTRDGSARVTVVNSTEIVNKMIGYHHTSPTSTAAFGRTLTAASMMGSLLKEKDDTLTLRIIGDGPAGAIVAIADYKGNVRGYMQDPTADLPTRSDGKLDVRGIIGHGQLSVTREYDGGAPQSGTVELVSGEIAEDICEYFAVSEQLPTVCALGVLVDRDGSCKAAGGIMIQLLPFADEETIEKLEKNAPRLSNISYLFDSGMKNGEILQIALDGIEYDEFDEFSAEYKCTCERSRFLGAIASFSDKELSDMFLEKGEIEAVCRFCDKKYVFTKDDIARERERRAKEK